MKNTADRETNFICLHILAAILLLFALPARASYIVPPDAELASGSFEVTSTGPAYGTCELEEQPGTQVTNLKAPGCMVTIKRVGKRPKGSKDIDQLDFYYENPACDLRKGQRITGKFGKFEKCIFRELVKCTNKSNPQLTKPIEGLDAVQWSCMNKSWAPFSKIEKVGK